jgi:hypothetical protein
MTRYQVHYSIVPFVEGQGFCGRIRNLIRYVVANSEAQAIARCKLNCPGSFDHWVNRLANEATK